MDNSDSSYMASSTYTKDSGREDNEGRSDVKEMRGEKNYMSSFSKSKSKSKSIKAQTRPLQRARRLPLQDAYTVSNERFDSPPPIRFFSFLLDLRFYVASSL